MVALVDERLIESNDRDPKLRYLLELLGDSSIDAYRFADHGPVEGTPQLVNEEDVFATEGWAEVLPGRSEHHRIIAWVQEGQPVNKSVVINDSAYDGINQAAPHPTYAELGDPANLRRDDAHAMLAAKHIRADLFVTERPMPLEFGNNASTTATAVTPHDALPIVALYLRQQHRPIIARGPALGAPNGQSYERKLDMSDFFWQASQILLRDTWRWRIASAAHSEATNDNSLSLLSITPPHRLSQILAARDRLLVSSSVSQNMDSAFEAGDQLDMILLWLMSAFDALARVTNDVLKIDERRRFAGWQKDTWIKAVCKKSAPLEYLFSSESTGGPLIDLLSKLRNNIHGQALSATGKVPRVGEHSLQTFLELPGEDRDQILESIERLGGVDIWGIARPHAGHDLCLQPGIFVERLIPQAIELINWIMTVVPIETLEGVDHPENLKSGLIPLDLSRKRILWQLGLQPPPVKI